MADESSETPELFPLNPTTGLISMAPGVNFTEGEHTLLAVAEADGQQVKATVRWAKDLSTLKIYDYFLYIVIWFDAI